MRLAGICLKARNRRSYQKIWSLLYLLHWNGWAEAVREKVRICVFFLGFGLDLFYFSSFFMTVPLKGTQRLFNCCNTYITFLGYFKLECNFSISQIITFFLFPYFLKNLATIHSIIFQQGRYRNLLQILVLVSFSHLPLCYETASLLWQSHCDPPVIILLFLSLNNFHMLNLGQAHWWWQMQTTAEGTPFLGTRSAVCCISLGPLHPCADTDFPSAFAGCI